jgi:threonine dehydratase
MLKTTHRLSLERIEQSAQSIDPVFLNSPQFVCEPLSNELGVRLVLKIETLNPIRCFKGRGADFLVAEIQPNMKTHLVCASAGNFGQAMAYSCRKRGLSLTIYAATQASPLKIGRMRELGAEVRLEGDDFDAAKQAAKQFAQERGYRFVEDSFDVETAEGAGTIGLELLQFPEPLQSLLIPLGNGALINGIARAVKAHSPQTQIIAIQSVGAPAMVESWQSGQMVIHEQIQTIADGIGVRIPVPQALEDMRGLVDDAILVAEATIVRAMRLLHQHVGIVAEPSAAVGVAAILEQPERFRGQLLGTIICGSNLTLEQMQSWLS